MGQEKSLQKICMLTTRLKLPSFYSTPSSGRTSSFIKKSRANRVCLRFDHVAFSRTLIVAISSIFQIHTPARGKLGFEKGHFFWLQASANNAVII